MEGLDSFKSYLLQRELDPETADKHLASLRNIYHVLGTWDKDIVKRYIFWLFEKDRSPGHLNNLIAALRHYGDFTGNSFRHIKYFKIHETQKGILSDNEIRAFLAIIPEEMEVFLQQVHEKHAKQIHKIHIDKELFLQFTFFFTCLAHTGMRPKEMVRLRATQVDFGSGVIRLDEKTKTGKPRTIAISEMLFPLLEKHVQLLEGNRLFPDYGRHQWGHQFKMRIQYLGIKREKISTYSLRHSWITSLLDNEANLLVVSDMAGHSNLNTTAHYYKLTTKSKKRTIKRLSLASAAQNYYVRFKQYRDEERKLREHFAQSPEEEKQMLNDLLNLP